MKKVAPIEFICTNCGAHSSRWEGKCAQCHEWNTLQQVINTESPGSTLVQGQPLKTIDVTDAAENDQTRIQTGLADIDELFGGGIVAGSVTLLAGQPGIGKSTILLQLAYAVAQRYPVLYVSGEESIHQVGMRAARLGTTGNNLRLVSSSVTDDIVATFLQEQYSLVIVDSIQTMSCNAVLSAAGSVSQITNSTQMLNMAAKQSNTAVILVGHVTKEGSIAGPKILEHAVDVVFEFEGDRYGGFKVLRTVKNRFGSTSNAAIYEMTDKGLRAVDNPSAALLAERQISDGSIVLATLEGTRPILVEVQALVNTSSYGYAKRASSGFDLNRLNLLLAMLERRTKLKLSDKDIYINIVGGIHIRDTAADLAICLAIGSATKGLLLKQNAVVFGEVGLSGEIRHVPYAEKRLTEAKKLGFSGGIGPLQKQEKKLVGLYGVSNVKDALNNFLEKE